MTLTRHERPTLRSLEGLGTRDLFDALMSRSLLAGEDLFDRTFDGNSRLMRIEEFTEGDESVIRAELPGVDPDKDVDITVDGGVLRITASREESSEEKRPDGYRSEFRYGTLVRSFRLPAGVSEDDVKATYKDGILEVRVPTPPEPEAAHKVAVGRG